MGQIASSIANATGTTQLLNTAEGAFGMGPNGQPNVSGYAPSANENAFTSALMARYNGTGGPSPAQLQMQQGLQTANQNANAQAAAARGINPALAARMAAQTQSSNQQSVLQNSGILGAEQQQASGNKLAGLLESQRQSAGAGNQLQASVANQQGNRLLSGAGTGLTAAGLANGGEVGAPSGDLLDLGSPPQGSQGQGSGGAADFLKALSSASMAHGGKVAVIVSPGEKILQPQEADRVANGDKGPLHKKDVPGKEKVPGDSLKNDTVPKKLAAGSVVVPKSQNDSDDKAAEFVKSLKGGKSERSKSYGDVLTKHRALEVRVKQLEAKLKKSS